jgi:hypothetical protein
MDYSNLYPMIIQEGLSEKRRLTSFLKDIEEFETMVIVCDEELPNCLHLSFMNNIVNVRYEVRDRFYKKFSWFIKDENNKISLEYDNLINLLIMVKDAGSGFRDMLIQNLPFIDRWTVLDTGSTDGTLETITEILGNIPGNLYQKPFTNFMDSRNELLELAGTSCFFNIMLDDTYILNGDVRKFLDMARSDDVADSYSIFIVDEECTYLSNRISKSDRGIRYVGKVHEILKVNMNLFIPLDMCYIRDIPSVYMKNRTNNRKISDLKTLKKMHAEDKSCSRTYYYIADSYLCLQKWGKALDWFKKRADMKTGTQGEIRDSLYYIAALSDEKLNIEWEKCHSLYLDCYNYDTSQTDVLFIIGLKYKKINLDLCYMYMKHAFLFQKGISQMSYRSHIYNEMLLLELLPLCYRFEDFDLGIKIWDHSQSKSPPRIQKICNKFKIIFDSLVKINNITFDTNELIGEESKKIICFLSPDGWNEWNGETYYEKGLGGSETFVVKYSEKLSELGYEVYVFCKCSSKSEYNGVIYFPVEEYARFIYTQRVDFCIINRQSCYLPLTYRSKAKNVYIVFHDLCGDEVIIDNHKLRKILLISDWHKNYFESLYPDFKNKCDIVSYGIDKELSTPHKWLEMGLSTMNHVKLPQNIKLVRYG